MAFIEWLKGVALWSMLTVGFGGAVGALAVGEVGLFVACALMAYAGWRGIERMVG